ncbi:MAG: transglycosylase SLT domain-containing protein [Elusimicrobia bacterium]|nr:transglycosylase SLT domain-containing protein [Elusimicrobiota bacterium]
MILLHLAAFAVAFAAPALPPEHAPHVLAAASEQGLDPGLLAAVCARESMFVDGAWRSEPGLRRVLWRDAPGGPERWAVDGSIGPCQVLRSNFRAMGIDNDAEAYDLANNYRVAAAILRWSSDAFPGSPWLAVTAYNTGVGQARAGLQAKGGYTATILAWAPGYRAALERVVEPEEFVYGADGTILGRFVRDGTGRILGSRDHDGRLFDLHGVLVEAL